MDKFFLAQDGKARVCFDHNKLLPGRYFVDVCIAKGLDIIVDYMDTVNEFPPPHRSLFFLVQYFFIFPPYICASLSIQRKKGQQLFWYPMLWAKLSKYVKEVFGYMKD